MGKIRVAGFGLSLDGYGAGAGQDIEHPLGIGGDKILQWLFGTRTFHAMLSGNGADATVSSGSHGIDDDFARAASENVGACIIGRNMFGPVRGPWLDQKWRGWWGEEPPFHVPVFVLTHYARPPLKVAGNTTFYFVTDGLESALKQARDAACDKDVRVGGGVSTIRQYLAAGLLDELHLAMCPALLGQGENLLNGFDLPSLGYAVTQSAASENALHVVCQKRRAGTGLPIF